MNDAMTPAVILVRPQMGENIGAAARAMMNFGLSDLRLVAPRDGWPNPKAHEMAAHADTIIEAAKVFETFEEAIADCHAVYATSARIRQFAVPMLTPEETAASLVTQSRQQLKTALVFGPERSGLFNEEVMRAQALVTISTHPDNASLNIAQSVVILAYQWWVAQEAGEENMKDEGDTSPPATAADVEYFFTQLDEKLEAGNFYHHPERAPAARRNIRAMLSRLPLTAHDVQMWHGILRTLTKR